MKLFTASYGLAVANILVISTLDSNAFSFPQRSPVMGSFGNLRITQLHESPTSEKTLRQEITEKSTIVNSKDEIKYATTIGEGTRADGEVVAINENENDIDGTTSRSIAYKAQMKKIERAIKPRAYPLFIAEKGAILMEDVIDYVMDKTDSSSVSVTGGGDNIKERVVILGTGWGAAAFLKEIDTTKFDVTIISPRNFFLFTPMLAGASVGTVEYRSITENIRGINPKASYLEGTAIEIDPASKTVLSQSVVCEGNSCSIEDFTVEYDKLLITVGAQTNTFGIPGVREYCCFLKQVEDARKIRTSIVNCFERANLPTMTEEQIINVLTFAVIGAGPTGVEFASELRDFIEQDGPKFYPNLLKYVRIKVIEASPTILAPFDKTLQEEAIKQLTRGVLTKDPEVLNLLPEKFQLTELLLNSGVSEVKEDSILLNDGKDIPYGLAVWAAGNGPLPITLQLIDSLKGDSEQEDAQAIARGRVATDAWLRVLGSGGNIMAFGDCSCITTGQLPATAQVAGQQGEYLARLLSQGYNMCPENSVTGIEESALLPPRPDPTRSKTVAENIAAFAIQADDIAAPFQFLNLGILAYTGGGSALAQLQITPADKGRLKGTGALGFGLWRSVYLSKQVSWRNRLLVFLDWGKTKVFGRDITRL